MISEESPVKARILKLEGIMKTNYQLNENYFTRFCAIALQSATLALLNLSVAYAQVGNTNCPTTVGWSTVKGTCFYTDPNPRYTCNHSANQGARTRYE